METSPRAKPEFGPSPSVANRAPLNSISQTALNQLLGEAGVADLFSCSRKMELSTPFERKKGQHLSRGAADYPPLAFADAAVTPEKYVLPLHAATTTPRSKYAWCQRPRSSTAVEAVCSPSSFRPSCPLSPLTEQDRASVGICSIDVLTPTRRLLQTPNVVESMTAYGAAAGNYISRPIARPSEIEIKVGLASVPAHTVPAIGSVRPEVQPGTAFQTPKAVIRRAPSAASCALPSRTTTCSDQQFGMEEDAEFWNTHNVQVLIRIRPLSTAEIASEGSSRCVRQETPKTITWLGSTESRFTFDHVACDSISQETLFHVAGLPMVNNCIAGYNSCIFAYGQTGSGKTYTMLGDIYNLNTAPCENRGITSRVFEHLFARIHAEEEAHTADRLEYHCKCTFLEIYNEQITDLLRPTSRNLQVREDTKKRVYVENLTEVEVTKFEDVIQLLVQGAANMKVAATKMNAESSRSHTVFTCEVERKWDQDSSTKNRRLGRLNLVDLAGSERQKTSGAEGEVFKEAAMINRSLHCLGNVLIALADLGNGRARHVHVPYRDSKLTFLLQDSLGGNSKTAVIANISPSICCSQETLSTLKFAQRAKRIQNNAVVNEEKHADGTALRNENEQLKEDLDCLRRQRAAWEEERKSLSRQLQQQEASAALRHENEQLKVELDCLRRRGAAWEEERKNLNWQLQQQEASAAVARERSAALAVELQRMTTLLPKETDAHQQAMGELNRERQDLLSKVQLLGSAEGQVHRIIDARLRRLEELEEARSSNMVGPSLSQDGLVRLDSEFYSFDNDRTQKHFASGQVWALYEDDMKPRRYAQVSEVSQAPFRLDMSWLKPRTEQNLAWDTASGMRPSCGKFEVGNNRRVVYGVDKFSHLMTPLGGLKEYINIYPRKQDVWALYRSCDEKRPSSIKSRDSSIQYDLVEVMSDFCDQMGVDVALLSKVSGFRTLFKRCQVPPMAYQANDLYRFSHRVPSHRMAGCEVAGVPKDCLELDPMCFPFEVLCG